MPYFLARITSSIKSLVRWILDARVAWLFLILLTAYWLISPILIQYSLDGNAICRERQIRLTGLLLQLTGIFTVAWGLHESRILFRKPTLFQRTAAWFKRFPLRKPKHLTLSATGLSIGSATSSARGRVGPGSSATVEQRLEILERGYAALFDEVGSIANDVRAVGQEAREGIKAEAVNRLQGDKRNEEIIENAMIGGLNIETAGVCYFALGAIFGTISSELAMLLGATACK